MDRRHSPRVCVQLPVQVWGLDAFGQPFTDSALVTNISAGGIVVRGIRRRMRNGEVLEVRMGSSRSRFRLIWVGESGEMGMQNLTAENFLPDSILAHCAQAAGAC